MISTSRTTQFPTPTLDPNKNWDLVMLDKSDPFITSMIDNLIKKNVEFRVLRGSLCSSLIIVPGIYIII